MSKMTKIIHVIKLRKQGNAIIPYCLCQIQPYLCSSPTLPHQNSSPLTRRTLNPRSSHPFSQIRSKSTKNRSLWSIRCQWKRCRWISASRARQAAAWGDGYSGRHQAAAVWVGTCSGRRQATARLPRLRHAAAAGVGVDGRLQRQLLQAAWWLLWAVAAGPPWKGI